MAMTRAFQRVGAAAGVAYALLAAIENLDVLQAPRYGAPVGEIVAAYSSGDSRAAVLAAAGALSLGAYVLAAVALWSVVGPGAHDVTNAGAAGAGRAARDRATQAWAVVGLAGGVTGPVLGAVALAVHGALVAGIGEGMSEDVVRFAYDLRAGAQLLAALPIGLFLAGTSIAGRRGGTLPRWLAWPGLAAGAGCVALAVAGPVLAERARWLVVVVLGAQTGWLLVASAWLLLSTWPPSAADSGWVTTARVLAGTVAAAAGVSGAALLAFPGVTADFFSWGLGPPPLASLIGGCYLASAVVYARASVAPWAELRVTMVAVVALTVPVLVATFAHLDIFDFDRLVAWAWVVLFCGFPVAAVATLVGQAASSGAVRGARREGRLDGTVRATAGALGGLGLITSLVLWADPTGAGADLLPFRPSLLGGRVLGGWTFLLATLALWVAVRGRRREARPALLALASFPLGAILAGLRSFGDLGPPVHRAAYLGVLLVWLGVSAALIIGAEGWRPGPPSSSPGVGSGS